MIGEQFASAAKKEFMNKQSSQHDYMCTFGMCLRVGWFMNHNLNGISDAYPHNVNLLVHFIPVSPVLGGVKDEV